MRGTRGGSKKGCYEGNQGEDPRRGAMRGTKGGAKKRAKKGCYEGNQGRS